MLSAFRNWSQSIVAKILLGILVLSFGVWGVSGVAGSAFEAALSFWGFGPKDLAKVGAITINGDEYTKTLQRQLQQASVQAQRQITLDEARKLGLQRQVLDAMVSQAAVSAAASKLNLAISQDLITNDLAREKQFQDTQGKFNPVVFNQVLRQNNITPEEYFAQQFKIRTEAAVLDAASGQLDIPRTFAEAVAQYQNETRDVKYFDVTASEADVAKPTDADIEAQYKKTPDAYTAPEYRTAALITIDVATLAPSEAVSDDEIKAAFDAQGKDFGTPEKRTIIQLTFPDVDAATKARARLDGGEDILKIAAELGKKEADVTLADKTRNDFLDARIGDAAFALKEGEVSEPVKGALATALLKAAKVTPGHNPTLDEIKPQLTQTVQTAKARARLQEIYQAVEDARAGQKKFEDIATDQKLNLTILPPISASGQNQDGKDMTAMVGDEALKAIFASDVGVENDPLGGQDSYTWYEVRSVVPSALKPLDQVKDQVAKDVTNARIRQAAIDRAEKVAAEIKAGKAIDAAAADAGTAIRTAEGLKRNQQTPTFEGPGLFAVFTVPDQGVTTSALGDGKSARVMQIAKVTLPSLVATDKDLDQVKQQLKASLANDLQAGLVAALKKSAGVKINTDLWKQNNGGEEPPAE